MAARCALLLSFSISVAILFPTFMIASAQRSNVFLNPGHVEQTGSFRESAEAKECLLVPNTGSCRAFLPSYYFNVQTGYCDCFVYGGCAPGGNNFNTIELCMSTCGVDPQRQVMSTECRRILASRDPVRNSATTTSQGASNGSISQTQFNQTSLIQLQNIFDQIPQQFQSNNPTQSNQQLQPNQPIQTQRPSPVTIPSSNQSFLPSLPPVPIPLLPSSNQSLLPLLPPLPLPFPPPLPLLQKTQSSSTNDATRRPISSSSRVPTTIGQPRPTSEVNGPTLVQLQQQEKQNQQLQDMIQRHQVTVEQQQRQQMAQLLQQTQRVPSTIITGSNSYQGQIAVGQPVRVPG